MNKNGSSQPGKNQKGFSLAELVVSMTVLSILLLGTSTLNHSMVRISTDGLQNGEFQNQLSYSFRRLEKDMSSASEIRIFKMPSPLAGGSISHTYHWSIRPVNGTAADDIDYEISLFSSPDRPSPVAGNILRTQYGKEEFLVPEGQLILGPAKYPVDPYPQLAVWLSDANKLMTINIGLKTTDAFGKEIINSGYTRSFYIQTAQVQDCTVMAC